MKQYTQYFKVLTVSLYTILYTRDLQRRLGLLTLVEEATENKGGHFDKLKCFCIAKITILWRGLKFKREHAPYFRHLCLLKQGVTIFTIT